MCEPFEVIAVDFGWPFGCGARLAEPHSGMTKTLSCRSLVGQVSRVARLRYGLSVDPLRAEEIERYRRQPPAERLRLALEVMADGIAMKRANLRRAHPECDDATIDAMLDAWLARA